MFLCYNYDGDFMTIVIRKMQENDYQDLKKNVFCATDISIIKENVKQNVLSMADNTSNWLYYVAEVDNKVVGTMYIEFNVPFVHRHIGTLYSVVVTEAYRGQGICRALFNEIIKVAKAKGCEMITLSVRGGTPAEIVYQKLGFIKYGLLPKGIKEEDHYFDSIFFYYPLI